MKKLLFLCGFLGLCFADENQLKLDFQHLMSRLWLPSNEVESFLLQNAEELKMPAHFTYLLQLLKRSYNAIKDFNPEVDQKTPLTISINYFFVIDQIRTFMERSSIDVDKMPEWAAFMQDAGQASQKFKLINSYAAINFNTISPLYIPIERSIIMAGYAQKLQASDSLHREIIDLFHQRLATVRDQITAEHSAYVSSALSLALNTFLPEELMRELIATVPPDIFKKEQKDLMKYWPDDLVRYVLRYPTMLRVLLDPESPSYGIRQILESSHMTIELFDKLRSFFTLPSQEQASVMYDVAIALLAKRDGNKNLLYHITTQAFQLSTSVEQNLFFNTVINRWLEYTQKLYESGRNQDAQSVVRGYFYIKFIDHLLSLNPHLKLELKKDILESVYRQLATQKSKTPTDQYLLAVERKFQELNGVEIIPIIKKLSREISLFTDLL
jgi:hypothetical protein